jgi:hypothetical protein
MEAMRDTGSIFGLAIDGFIARGGVGTVDSLQVVTGAPIRQKGQVAAESVIERLTQADIVKKHMEGGREYYGLTPGIPHNHQSWRALRLAEAVVLDGVREWARRLSVASYDKIEVRSPGVLPRFGTFNFDVCGPSYLLPLTSAKADKTKPGFFVADVFIDSKLGNNSIKYFLRKIQLLKEMGKFPNFLPMLVATEFTLEALHAGKRNGVMMATLDNLFGAAVGRALKSLVDTLQNAAAVAAADPDRIGQLLDSLSTIEGAAGNLRGALFEMLVGFLVQQVEGGSIDIGETIYHPATGQQAEIDVRRVKEKVEVWCYECRGRQPTNQMSLDEVKDWLVRVDRIAAAHNNLQRFQGAKFGFELWTSGQFENDALEFLKAEKAKRKRVAINWLDGAAVRTYAQRANRRSILKTLDDHYTKHALTRALAIRANTEES